MTCREEKRSDQEGLSNVRREASCSSWLQRKRGPEQVVQPSASGATEEGKNPIKDAGLHRMCGHHRLTLPPPGTRRVTQTIKASVVGPLF